MSVHRFCVVIPNYNHRDNIEHVLDALAHHSVTVVLVDDGSDETTRTLLHDLAEARPSVVLQRLDVNQGKGGAVMHGLRHAHTLGFTHALQIDADGQHNLDDVERFLAESRQHPDDLICGVPSYDQSVPKGRLVARYLTHIWVWIETLSLQIRDSMCGFRVYPLAACIDLADRVRLGRRMDFDIEILVRLFWDGIHIRNLETRVVYPEGGVSHFRLFSDNWLISRMHTRLFFGMLWRAPGLLVRRLGKRSHGDQHWSQRPERGSLWGIRFFLLVYRLLGARPLRWLMQPVLLYFFLTGRSARNASLDYLRRRHRFAADADLPLVKPNYRNAFQHFQHFADCALDRIVAWRGDMRQDRVAFPERQAFLDLIEAGQGAVIIGSHHGNLDVIRAFADLVPGLRLRVLVFTEHAERFNQVLNSVNPDLSRDLIPVSRVGVDTAIVLKQSIEQGEYVVIVGDRVSATARERVRWVEFLGQPAAFAQGPFVLASLMDCPVYTMFCVGTGDGDYRVRFQRLADSLAVARSRRDEMLADAMAEYAKRLQQMCLHSPFMWFNFFDFWADPENEKDQLTRNLDETPLSRHETP